MISVQFSVWSIFQFCPIFSIFSDFLKIISRYKLKISNLFFFKPWITSFVSPMTFQKTLKEKLLQGFSLKVLLPFPYPLSWCGKRGTLSHYETVDDEKLILTMKKCISWQGRIIEEVDCRKPKRSLTRRSRLIKLSSGGNSRFSHIIIMTQSIVVKSRSKSRIK